MFIQLENKKILNSLANIITENFLNYSNCDISSLTIQCYIESIAEFDNEDFNWIKNDFSFKIKLHFQSLISDKHGNHVVRKIVNSYQVSHLEEIIETTHEHVISLLIKMKEYIDHCYGSRIIQDIIINFSKKVKFELI